MTNYIGLINSMLELRNQRLKESMFRAQQQQEEMAALGKGIGGMIGGIGKGFAANAQDSRMNAMLNRVDPGSPYTGGMDEFKLRLALQDQRNQNMGSQLSQDRFSYAKETDQRDYNRQVSRDSVADENTVADNLRAERALTAQENERARQDAEKKAANATKGLKDDFNDMESFHASMRVHENDMRDAPDKYSYEQAARSAHSLWSAAKKRGLDVGDGPPDIAPFMTPTQKADIQAQQIKVSEAQKGIAEAQREPDSWLGKTAVSMGMQPSTAKDSAIKQAQDRYKMEQDLLQSMRKGGEPVDPSAAAQANSNPSIPIGKTQKNLKTKQVRRWNGKEWEIVQ